MFGRRSFTFLLALCLPSALFHSSSLVEGCSTDEDCSFLGECSNQVCSCRKGFRGVACEHIDNKTVPVENGLILNDYWVWGSQIIYEEGMYHMFASIYPRNLSFGGHWLSNAQIARATSGTAEGPYKFQEIVLPYHEPPEGSTEQYWDRSVMNPKIVRALDGTFLIYYTGDTYNGSMPEHESDQYDKDAAQCSQRVGLAYAMNITGPWTRLPEPVLLPRQGKWDDRMTTNVAVTVLPDGKVLAVYKASTPPSGKQTQVCLGAAIAPHWKGPYERVRDDPIIPCPKNSFDFEDPAIWYDQTSKTVHMLVKDFHGTVTKHGYSGAHLYSKDNGVTWNFTQPAFAYDTVNLWSDGKVRKQRAMERVQVLLDEEGFVSHITFATNTGLDGKSNYWNMIIPVQ